MDTTDVRAEASIAQYDWSHTPPSVAVIDAIAEIENVESSELSGGFEGTLFDYVDPDALDTLASADTPVIISFSIGEYAVRIDGNELTVTRRETSIPMR